VELRAEVLPGLPQVAVDHERIELVFDNLIANAIRYGPERGTVTVRARCDDARTRFEVHDDGPGIPQEYREAIFEKYARVPGVPAGGSGIGLFIARQIVLAHGGDIGVDVDASGTTFWFTVLIAS
jgi:signal transduction histidine kinase